MRDAGLGDRGCMPGATSIPASDLLGGGDAVHTVVVCEIVHAAGTVFARRLRAVRGSAASVVWAQTQTIFTDLATGAVGTGEGLVSDASALWQPLIEALRRSTGSLSLRPVEPPTPEELAALAEAVSRAEPWPDEIILSLPDGFSTRQLDWLAGWRPPGPEHPIRVALPRAAVDGVLTDLGRAAVQPSGPFDAPTTAGASFDRTPCDLVPCMALTLDDGPGGLTPGILDVLRDTRSAATFYMLGQNAARNPDTVRRVAAEGHQIGNHTWDHPYLVDLTDEQITRQLDTPLRCCALFRVNR